MSPQGLHKRTVWADTRCPPKFIGNIQTHNFRNDHHGDLTYAEVTVAKASENKLKKIENSYNNYNNFVEKNGLLKTMKKTDDKWDQNEEKKRKWIKTLMWKKDRDPAPKLHTGFSLV